MILGSLNLVDLNILIDKMILSAALILLITKSFFKGLPIPKFSLLLLAIFPIYFALGFENIFSNKFSFYRDFLIVLFLILHNRSINEGLFKKIINLTIRYLPLFLALLLIEFNNVSFNYDLIRDIDERNYRIVNYCYLVILITPIIKTDLFTKTLKYLFISIFFIYSAATLSITGLILSSFILLYSIFKFNKIIFYLFVSILIAFIVFYFANYIALLILRIQGYDFILNTNPRIFELQSFFKNLNFFNWIFGLGLGSTVSNPFYGILPSIKSNMIDMVHIGYFHLIMKGGITLFIYFIFLQIKLLKNHNYSLDFFIFLIIVNILNFSHQRFDLDIVSLYILVLISYLTIDKSGVHFKYRVWRTRR